jgi:hypothetical protein
MPKSKRVPRFFLSSSQGLLNQLFRFYLWENFRIRAEIWKARKGKHLSSDVLLHNGNQPLRPIQPGSVRLVVFQSEWNAADRLLWAKKGASHLISLSDPISAIHKNIKLLAKSKC